MIQHVTRNKERLQEKIQQVDKEEKDTYDQGVKRLGFDPIKHFPDVCPEKKSTELPPLRIINNKIDIIDKEQYQQLSCRRIKPKEAFIQQLRQKLDAELDLG